MARATDGASGSALTKPARVSPGGDKPAARAAKPPQARRPFRLWSVTVQFLTDVRAEMNRVAWPDRQTVIASSLVVVFVLVVTALYLAGWDLFFAKMFQYLFKQ